MLSSIVETILVKKYDLDVSWSTYNIDKGNWFVKKWVVYKYEHDYSINKSILSSCQFSICVLNSQTKFWDRPTLQPLTKDILLMLWKYIVIVYIIRKGIWCSGMIVA